MTDDVRDRDAAIAINSYTTVRRRESVPHEHFTAYWRDVHGPLCSRIPGLGWYVQHHFARLQDAHLWPMPEGVGPLAGYVLDGAVEIGFASGDDQATFQEASSILFSDEQNVFEETVAYDLPDGSTTLVDHQADATPNGPDRLDRVHVHLSVAPGSRDALAAYAEAQLGPALAADAEVVKVRLHRPEHRDNSEPKPPAPNVAHDVPVERQDLVILEVAFVDPLARRRCFDSPAVASALDGLAGLVTHVTPFAVSTLNTFVRDGTLTTAGLRGSQVAELIRRLAASNQVADDVRELMHRG